MHKWHNQQEYYRIMRHLMTLFYNLLGSSHMDYVRVGTTLFWVAFSRHISPNLTTFMFLLTSQELVESTATIIAITKHNNNKILFLVINYHQLIILEFEHRLKFEIERVRSAESQHGILMTATREWEHKAIIKHRAAQDGILAWQEFIADFEFDGSKELKFKRLEAQIQIPFSQSEPRGMLAYIDKFQATMAQLEVMDPDYTSPVKMKRMLLANIRNATG